MKPDGFDDWPLEIQHKYLDEYVRMQNESLSRHSRHSQRSQRSRRSRHSRRSQRSQRSQRHSPNMPTNQFKSERDTLSQTRKSTRKSSQKQRTWKQFLWDHKGKLALTAAVLAGIAATGGIGSVGLLSGATAATGTGAATGAAATSGAITAASGAASAATSSVLARTYDALVNSYGVKKANDVINGAITKLEPVYQQGKQLVDYGTLAVNTGQGAATVYNAALQANDAIDNGDLQGAMNAAYMGKSGVDSIYGAFDSHNQRGFNQHQEAAQVFRDACISLKREQLIRKHKGKSARLTSEDKEKLYECELDGLGY